MLAAGAVNSAALLLASANEACPDGLANRSGMVGRNFMNHNSSAMLVVDPRLRNTSVYQKTSGSMISTSATGMAARPRQRPASRQDHRADPEGEHQIMPMPSGGPRAYSFDWYLMSEDLPNPESRVTLDGGRIVLDWKRST